MEKRRTRAWREGTELTRYLHAKLAGLDGSNVTTRAAANDHDVVH